MRQVYSTLLPLAGDPATSAAGARDLTLAWAFKKHGGVPAGGNLGLGEWTEGWSQITWSSLEVEGGDPASGHSRGATPTTTIPTSAGSQR